MSRYSAKIPTYRKHRASGQAIVTLSGQDHYLGPHGSKASRLEYDRLIAEWIAAGRTLIDPQGVTIAELLKGYREHCEREYPAERTSEGQNIRHALKPLRELFGSTPAAEFGPLRLKALIQNYIGRGWTRKSINRQIGRVKQFFKWAVANELIPPTVPQALASVEGLRAGRGGAPESQPVRPVHEDHVRLIYPHVNRFIQAMIELQLLSGMRPGEVCIMRGCDLDTSGELWTYRPAQHKNQHRGIDRTIYLGPKAQDVLRPFLKPDLQAYLFSPAQAETERRAKLSANRKTPLSCGNRPGTNKRRKPQRTPGAGYSREAYTLAVYIACSHAFPYPNDCLTDEQQKRWREDHYWSPNQLRHTAATGIRKTFGAEAAQTILGHTQLRTTEIYAEKNHEQAKKIMAKIG